MTNEPSPKLDQLITALGKQLNLTGKEIADILWLALQRQEFGDIPNSPVSPPSEPKTDKTKQPSKPPQPVSPVPPPKTTPYGEVYAKTDRQTSQQGNLLPIKVPNARSLRQPLKLTRALRPLMQKISSGNKVVLDEQATADRFAEEHIRIPVLKPTLEPWLDLALVVDESNCNSMIFWRQTIQELQQLLKHYGAFRDVRTWRLVTDEDGKVNLRQGIRKKARHPRELIDPTGQRLILVVSDCVSPIWRNGEALSILKTWVKQSPVAIIQMLPEWLWLRTGLSLGAMVQLGSLTPGIANQSLLIKEILLWDDINFATGIKIPVLTLEPDVAATWSKMVAGKSYARAAGFVFSSEFQPVEDSESESSENNQERVSSFRLTASPIARKLASLLSAAPIITLPIVRLIQQNILPDSQQVHVAEVFLGGILKPLSSITPESNPDQIQYVFIDEEIRDIFLKAAPLTDSSQILDAISQDFANRLGKSMKDFYALLKKPGTAIEGFDIKPFALVTAKVLKRLGGESTRFAEELEKNWQGTDSPEVVAIPLQPFEFDVATVEVKRSGRRKNPQVTISRSRHQAQFFQEDLGNGVVLEMVEIPGGEFLMGSPDTEEGRLESEGPQHQVRVPPFFMGKYPITQAQWQAVAAFPQVNRELNPDPSYFKGSDRLVENVSWYDADEFCARLSKATGRDYRLPSEAEWEYACRAGTTTPFHFGETITPELANYNGNHTYGAGPKGEYRKETTPVGNFQVSNAFGLSDMHGNVWEWCADHWHEKYDASSPLDGNAWYNKNENDNQIRLLRGGSWDYDPGYCRSAYRNNYDPGSRLHDIGFRVVVSRART